MIWRATVMTCLLTGLALVGCGGDNADSSKERLEAMAGGELKETVPVSGTVSIDGVPAMGVNLDLYPAAGGAAITHCRTKLDGTYCWSSYVACDGLPPGEYRLGFTYVPKEKRNGEGVDEFHGKYKNPAKGDFVLKVESGQPQTNVDYDFDTSSKKK